jgi:hypothetical protein
MADTLGPNTFLSIGGCLTSAGGTTQLCLIKGIGHAFLNTVGVNNGLDITQAFAQPGVRLLMQADGNLVLLNSRGQNIWTSKTQGHPGASLVVLDDGSATIVTPDGKKIWNSGKPKEPSGLVHALGKAAPGIVRGLSPIVPGAAIVSNMWSKGVAGAAPAATTSIKPGVGSAGNTPVGQASPVGGTTSQQVAAAQQAQASGAGLAALATLATPSGPGTAIIAVGAGVGAMAVSAILGAGVLASWGLGALVAGGVVLVRNRG